MSPASRIPGMRPGWSIWNLVLGAVYLTLFPLVIGIFPLAAGVMVWRNSYGLADRFAALPGISETGGITAGAVACLYIIAVYGVIGLASPSGSGGASPQQTVPAEPSPTSTVTAISSPTYQRGSTTDSPTASPTARSPKTSTPTTSPTKTNSPTPDKPGLLVTIVEVVDGDTVKIKYQNGFRDTARLLGVDTPETYGDTNPGEFEGVPSTQAGRDCLARWGKNAKEHTRARLLGDTIRITFDKNEPRRGYYGRLLVYIHTDRGLYNHHLVAIGYARVYTDSEFTKESRFLDTEDDAQLADTGLWECQNVATATPTPSRSGNVIILSVHADAAGDEYDNLDDEYIVLKNEGSSAVDVSGWTIVDEAGHTYTIPAGVTIDAGEKLYIHTGSGSNSATHLYWDRDSPVWNNGGDIAVLRNDSGTEKDRYEYDG